MLKQVQHDGQFHGCQMYKLCGSVALALSLAWPGLAYAQAANCRPPESFAAPRVESGPSGGPAAQTGSLLALSWSPQFCREQKGNVKHRTQCSGENGRFGFIVHGLWPEGPGRDDPQYCAPARPLSRALVRRFFCMTPSPNLLQHEWTKHGTCAAARAEDYFISAEQVFSALRFPDMNHLSRGRATVQSFKSAFTALNPAWSASSISVQTGQGGWLKEIRLCMDTRERPRACPVEDRGAPAGAQLRIWRLE